MGESMEIIEDCSPYYIRFTHDGINDLVDLCQSYVTAELLEKNKDEDFFNHKLPLNQSEKVLSLLPFLDKIKLIKERVSLFVTKPGYYYRAHKDGPNHRCSLNYTIIVMDNKCVTSWYSDDILNDYTIDSTHKDSRECLGFVKENQTPIKSMIAKPNEAILFNTEIFHDWDNTNSENYRVVLTLRSQNPGEVYFNDVKNILF